MAAITNFVPKVGVDARINVQSFVETWRGNSSSIKDIAWDDNTWDVTEYVVRTGRAQARTIVLFNTLEASKNRCKVQLSDPFRAFAKAYTLHIYATSGKTYSHGHMSALRALEAALIRANGRSDVEGTNAAVCNIAATLVREKFERGAAYDAGRRLGLLAKFLSENGLVAAPFQWCNPLRRGERYDVVGQEADERRAKKIPSTAALDALPKCFKLATETRDVVATSIAALLCCAPDRISEVFSLPLDCEVEQEHKGKMVYGLRWWPAKGATPMVKWVAPIMVEVAKAAVSKLRAACAPAREVAAWYCANPDKMFLPPHLEHLRGSDTLTFDDLPAMLGMASAALARQWCCDRGVPVGPKPSYHGMPPVRFADVEKVVLAMLPRGFPVLDRRTGLSYDEALIVLRPNEAYIGRPPFLPMVIPVGTQMVNTSLGSRRDRCSVFGRFGLTEPDGSPIVVTSHQFRHWLNTLAHRGGMSQIDIAKWSGRKDIKHNEAYNNMTGTEMVAMARSMTDGDERLFGPLAELAAKAPVSRDEFLELEFPTAHVTELGFCVHDYTMLPCQRHRDCVNCNEHVCVKGDRDKTSRIRRHLEVAEDQLRRAEDAKADGYVGADRWQEHHQASVRRLRNLVDILDDPDVPMGSLIRLTNRDEFSPIAKAVEERKQLGIDDMFAEAALLLGGA